MKKIKVFKFEVSNASIDFVNASKMLKDRLESEQDIEAVVNEFIQDKTLIDIKINHVDVNYHNNGYTNTIYLYYTIIYE